MQLYTHKTSCILHMQLHTIMKLLAHTRALRRINVFLNIILKSSIEVIIEIIKLIAIQLKT